MGVCFLYGNGGSGEKDRLNFRVFGGLTAPESPKENDIWVKTSLAIPNGSVFFNEYTSAFWLGVSNGGLYIPMVASNSGLTKSTGMNCVVGTGYLAEFNVNLIGCQQKVDGAWKSRDAWIWHGSQWHQFSSTQYTIFNAGGATDYSGGWKAYAYKSQSSGSTPKAPTFTLGSTMDISLYGQYSYNMGTVFSESAIDLTKYSTLVIEVSSTQTGIISGSEYGGFSCGLCASKQNNWTPAATATNVSAGTHAIDISALSGSYYLSLSLGGVGQGVTGKASITRIYLK